MDTNLHIRTYQNSSIKYRDIIKSILSNYINGNYIVTAENNKNIENLVLQYKESNWEFIKRFVNEAMNSNLENMKDIAFYYACLNVDNSVDIDLIERY